MKKYLTICVFFGLVIATAGAGKLFSQSEIVFPDNPTSAASNSQTSIRNVGGTMTVHTGGNDVSLIGPAWGNGGPVLWVTGHNYIVGDMVLNLGSSFRCITAHTSTGTSFSGGNHPPINCTSDSNWAAVACVGSRGATGLQGPPGQPAFKFAGNRGGEVLAISGNSPVSCVQDLGSGGANNRTIFVNFYCTWMDETLGVTGNGGTDAGTESGSAEVATSGHWNGSSWVLDSPASTIFQTGDQGQTSLTFSMSGTSLMMNYNFSATGNTIEFICYYLIGGA